MTTAAARIQSTASIERAREIMRDHGVRCLPVVDDGRLVGIVTDEDIRDATSEPADESLSQVAPADVYLVRDVMTAPVVAIHPHAPVQVAAMIMETEGFGSLPVAVCGELCGIIARSEV